MSQISPRCTPPRSVESRVYHLDLAFVGEGGLLVVQACATDRVGVGREDLTKGTLASGPVDPGREGDSVAFGPPSGVRDRVVGKGQRHLGCHDASFPETGWVVSHTSNHTDPRPRPPYRRAVAFASSLAAYGASCRRYRPARRRGSEPSRYSHSRPPRCIQPGARLVSPATKLIAAPQPTNQVLGSAGRSAEMTSSCSGYPSPTNTKSGRAATTAPCTSDMAKPKSGLSPATRSPGQARLSAAPARAAPLGVPGAPPSRNTERRSAPRPRDSDQIRLAPATRSGSGVPASRLAHTSGIPSATIRVASAAYSSGPWRRMSTFGVRIRPPSPRASASRTRSTASASVTAWKPTPASSTFICRYSRRSLVIRTERVKGR